MFVKTKKTAIICIFFALMVTAAAAPMPEPPADSTTDATSDQDETKKYLACLKQTAADLGEPFNSFYTDCLAKTADFADSDGFTKEEFCLVDAGESWQKAEKEKDPDSKATLDESVLFQCLFPPGTAGQGPSTSEDPAGTGTAGQDPSTSADSAGTGAAGQGPTGAGSADQPPADQPPADQGSAGETP
ncbi:hypothetical protein BGZ94_006436 [Podila epigama]|nr:hypothetical protein BGZ94_006436 [Podila epigama]